MNGVFHSLKQRLETSALRKQIPVGVVSPSEVHCHSLCAVLKTVLVCSWGWKGKDRGHDVWDYHNHTALTISCADPENSLTPR